MNRTLRKRKLPNSGKESGVVSDQTNKRLKADESREVEEIVPENPTVEVTAEEVTRDKSAAEKKEVVEELDRKSKTDQKGTTEEEKVNKKEVKPEEGTETVEVETPDPYAFLSEADRKLFQTDIVEFLKRFTPRYFVPVYRTWSIPKSVAKQST